MSSGRTGSSFGNAPGRVRRPVGPPAADAAAGHDHRLALRPVVAAGVLVDLRRAAEVAGPVDQRLVQQPAVLQVFEQGGERPVGVRQAAVLERGEVVLVRVPAADARRSSTRSRTARPPRPAGGPGARSGRRCAGRSGRGPSPAPRAMANAFWVSRGGQEVDGPGLVVAHPLDRPRCGRRGR